MELSENLYEDYDQPSILNQEMSSNLLLSEMLGSTEETLLMWPAGVSTTTVTTNTPLLSFPATVKRPQCDVLPGPFDFNIDPAEHKEDAHCVYSQLLHKLFTDVGKSVRFNVTLADWTASTGLFIRALPLFSPESDSFEEPVKTCPTHEDKSHTLNEDCSAVRHIVRCSDPQTQYQTDPMSGRYSVVTQLSAPQPGATSVPLLYTFVCKNSCRGGIGRRALILLFTLEDLSGDILGRRQLEVRVCSCPRRDKAKQEQQFRRNHLRDQSEDIQSETKSAIQQLVHASRSQPLQEVPQSQVVTVCQRDLTQECDNIASRAHCNIIDTQGQQAEPKYLEMEIPLIHQGEVMRQALAIMWRIAGENQVPFSESDSLFLQICRESC